MVEYEAPDDLPRRDIELAELAHDWVAREVDTQSLGDAWLDRCHALSSSSIGVPRSSAHRSAM